MCKLVTLFLHLLAYICKINKINSIKGDFGFKK